MSLWQYLGLSPLKTGLRPIGILVLTIQKRIKIVKTNDIEYQNLVKKIVSQTVVHKGMIDKKIATVKNAK